MKKIKEFIEHLIIVIGCVWFFTNYVQYFKLTSKTFDKLFAFKDEEWLTIYIQRDKLSEGEIAKVITKSKLISNVKLVLKNKLTDLEGEALIQRNESFLFEFYFNPSVGFDTNRRFSRENEFRYIESMVQNTSYAHQTIFKLYIDNALEDLITDDIFCLVMEYGSWYASYILQKAEFNDDQENVILSQGINTQVSAFIKERFLSKEKSQILLIENHIDVAKSYIARQRVSSKAFRLFKEKSYAKA